MNKIMSYVLMLLLTPINFNLFGAATLIEHADIEHVGDEQRLMDAVKSGNSEAIVTLKEAGADVNFMDEQGNTPLMLAAGSGNKEIVRLLLESGADLAIKNKLGKSSLDYAQEINPLDSEELRKNKSDTLKLIREYELRSFAYNGDIDKIIKLIESGVNVNATSQRGHTALMSAASKGHKDIVGALIKAGANVNAVDNYGHTALIDASFRGYLDIVLQLLAAGANTDKATNNYGETSLMAAVLTRNKEITRQLLLAGADLDILNKKGKKVIDYVGKEFSFSGREEEDKKTDAEILELLKAEPERRKVAIKNRQEAINKLVGVHLPPVLTPIIAEYTVGNIKDIA